jgi:hypothetical protein
VLEAAIAIEPMNKGFVEIFSHHSPKGHRISSSDKDNNLGVFLFCLGLQ